MTEPTDARVRVLEERVHGVTYNRHPTTANDPPVDSASAGKQVCTGMARPKQRKRHMDNIISALVIGGSAVTLWAVLLLGPPILLSGLGVAGAVVLVLMAREGGGQ